MSLLRPGVIKQHKTTNHPTSLLHSTMYTLSLEHVARLLLSATHSAPLCSTFIFTSHAFGHVYVSPFCEAQCIHFCVKVPDNKEPQSLGSHPGSLRPNSQCTHVQYNESLYTHPSGYFCNAQLFLSILNCFTMHLFLSIIQAIITHFLVSNPNDASLLSLPRSNSQCTL